MEGESLLDSRPEGGTKMTFQDHMRSPVMEVHIGTGPNAATFHVHKSLLMEKSTLFRDHLGRRSNHGKRSMTILPYIQDGRHLEPFIFWLYNDHGDVLNTGDKPAYDIGQLWVIAEEIESTEYRNFLADTIQRVRADNTWYLRSYDELCAMKSGSSPLGIFMIECLAYKVITQGWAQLVGDGHDMANTEKWFGQRRDLLHQLMLRVDERSRDMRTGTLTDPTARDDCMLHLHETEESREDCPRHGKVERDSDARSPTEDGVKEEDRSRKRARGEEPESKTEVV